MAENFKQTRVPGFYWVDAKEVYGGNICVVELTNTGEWYAAGIEEALDENYVTVLSGPLSVPK